MNTSRENAPTGERDGQAAREALAWVIAMGADEIVLEAPQNRFALSTVVQAPVVKSPAPGMAPPLPTPQGPLHAQALAASAVSLLELKQALSFFTVNPLRKGASNICLYEGPVGAPILVLGDVPRAEEDKSGQVIAGKPRELLSRMLSAIGLSLESVMLANLIALRPPGNRKLTEQEIILNLPFAQRLIELAAPQFILGIGAMAGHHLGGGDASLLRQRGKWLEVNGVPFLSTFHPEELLKLPQQKKLAWRDLLAFQKRQRHEP